LSIAKPPLTHWLSLAAQGQPDALHRVFEVLYPDLRRLARARIRLHSENTLLGTTDLVHESFTRMVGNSQLVPGDRRHFFAYAAKTMRNIIIDAARRKLAGRRGGGAAKLALDTALPPDGGADPGADALVRINDALLVLEAVDSGLAHLVEMRYFAGYSEAEIAELTGQSERTVRRQWEKARAFLLIQLAE
jgi:RNA polymerase sigma factor (TIGR02999 family)